MRCTTLIFCRLSNFPSWPRFLSQSTSATHAHSSRCSQLQKQTPRPSTPPHISARPDTTLQDLGRQAVSSGLACGLLRPGERGEGNVLPVQGLGLESPRTSPLALGEPGTAMWPAGGRGPRGGAPRNTEEHQPTSRSRPAQRPSADCRQRRKAAESRTTQLKHRLVSRSNVGLL